jgi:hypothetical protein
MEVLQTPLGKPSYLMTIAEKLNWSTDTVVKMSRASADLAIQPATICENPPKPTQLAAKIQDTEWTSGS